MVIPIVFASLSPWIIAAVVLGLAASAALIIRGPMRRASERNRTVGAKREFQLERERLQARFFQLAAASGKPRGLRWTRCEFSGEPTYARDRKSGQISALLPVTISFEAIAGGLMEDVEAVGNLRAATAVFRRQPFGWDTDGRAVYNLDPAGTIAHYRDQLEVLPNEAVEDESGAELQK